MFLIKSFKISQGCFFPDNKIIKHKGKNLIQTLALHTFMTFIIEELTEHIRGNPI